MFQYVKTAQQTLAKPCLRVCNPEWFAFLSGYVWRITPSILKILHIVSQYYIQSCEHPSWAKTLLLLMYSIHAWDKDLTFLHSLTFHTLSHSLTLSHFLYCLIQSHTFQILTLCQTYSSHTLRFLMHSYTCSYSLVLFHTL